MQGGDAQLIIILRDSPGLDDLRLQDMVVADAAPIDHIRRMNGQELFSCRDADRQAAPFRHLPVAAAADPRLEHDLIFLRRIGAELHHHDPGLGLPIGDIG